MSVLVGWVLVEVLVAVSTLAGWVLVEVLVAVSAIRASVLGSVLDGTTAKAVTRGGSSSRFDITQVTTRNAVPASSKDATAIVA